MVLHTVIHKNWLRDQSHQRSRFNIAMLKLPRKTVHPFPRILTDHIRLHTGQLLEAVGWGISSEGPRIGEDVFGGLKTKLQEFIAAVHCNRSTLWDGGMVEGTICGINRKRRASCIGEGAVIQLLPSQPGALIICKPFGPYLS